MAYRVLARFDDQSFRASLHEGSNVLGSDPSCDISLPNPTVSRRHAVVEVDGDEVTLKDLGSTNGTLLRSQRIDQAELEPGDIFVIGRVVVLLEEVPDEDLEVGIDVRRDESMSVRRPTAHELESEAFPEYTESFSPLDHFTLDHLPKVLEQLQIDAERQKVAQKVGHALYETMPVSAVEIIEVEALDEAREEEEEREQDENDEGDGRRGVLFSAHAEIHGEDGEAGDRAWVEAASSSCQIRVCFYKESAAEHYRPVVESTLLALSIADRIRGETTRTVVSATQAERPQPPSVEPAVQEIYEQAERVARGDVGVMIYGESGTGKEVLARFLHAASPRSSQPLVAINCASLPRDLLEAELFGVEKGVATGVEARAGKFESADQGTLFLDEIGDMAPETQAKILRVLQEKEVFRLGGHTPRPARARVIAATNRQIQEMIADGSFRSDLYHRIATWEVELPPLRSRRGDIPNLAAHFLSREAERHGVRARGISRAALKALRRYRWPGNIRQLKNEIARAVLFLEDGELLDTGRLSAAIRGQEAARRTTSLQEMLEAVERDEIVSALEATGGDTALAAEQLEISRPTLYRRIKNLEIEIPEAKKGEAG